MSYSINIQTHSTAAKYNFLQLICNRSAIVLQLKVFVLKYLTKVSIRKNLQKFHFCHTPEFFRLSMFHLRVSKNCTLRKPGVLEYLNIVCTKLTKQPENTENKAKQNENVQK